MWIYWVLGALAFALWVVPMSEYILSGWRPVPLSAIPPGEGKMPRLSVVVPALDEEDTVEAAMRSLLAVDYPDLEVIAVDDRSTDATGAILDRLAAENPRLRVAHIRQLPPGWLGKNHALSTGASEASGDYILFTDADAHFAPDALRRAVRYMRENSLDHLAVVPEVVLRGFWETLTVAFFGVVFTVTSRPWKVPDPRSRAFIGVGPFNMVRAEAYRRAGGFAALPMDVIEDMKLGKKIKENGGRSAFLLSGGMVRVRWIVGPLGLVRGLTKNLYAGFGYRPHVALAAVLGLLLMGVWPVAGLFVGPLGARLLCAATLLFMVRVAYDARPAPNVSPLYGLVYPLGALVMAFTILRSMAFTYARGGVIWRGTLYPLAELRRGVV